MIKVIISFSRKYKIINNLLIYKSLNQNYIVNNLICEPKQNELGFFLQFLCKINELRNFLVVKFA